MVCLVIRLVSQTGKFNAVRHIHGKTKLFGFGGTDVEKGHIAVQDRPVVSMLQDVKQDLLVKMPADLLLNCHLGHLPDLSRQLPMAVDTENPFIFSLIHILADHPNQPENPQDVVQMFMSDKDMM